jgi:hypothetical protein
MSHDLTKATSLESLRLVSQGSTPRRQEAVRPPCLQGTRRSEPLLSQMDVRSYRLQAFLS